jgi:hypothetical protein
MSMPVVTANNTVQYVRVDFAKDKLMVKVDGEYHELEDIQSIINDVDMFMRLGDDDCCDSCDSCDCCDK